jgi:hypothetical protein
MDVTDDEFNTVAASGLVDKTWYLARHPDVVAAMLDPIYHFCMYGWREAREPNTWFDPAWYLAGNPDVAANGLNPLVHYVTYGEQEGRQPSAYFDPGWYRIAYGLPEDASPLRHYLTHRTEGYFAPCAQLYAVPYLPQYAEQDAVMDPYRRYLDDQAYAGREPSPDEALIALSGLLDWNYYLIAGGDVREARLDPVEHFCRYGWRENRKPNIHFNTRWYTGTNPSVARLGINPLVHYICEGEAQGRRPVIYFDPVWYAMTYRESLQATGLRPLAHYLANRRSHALSPNRHFDAEWYVARYGAEIGPNREAFAHYLQMGTIRDLDPSPHFDAARYRRRHLGRLTRGFRGKLRPERDNPLMHYLRAQYPDGAHEPGGSHSERQSG